MGVTTTNDLQVLLPPTAVPVTQGGRLRGIGWGSRLQMAFKSSYHLQPCRLPKLHAGGASVGGHDYKWPSSPPITCSHAGYPSWTMEGCQFRVTTTDGLQVFLPFATVPVTQAGRWRDISWGSQLQYCLQRILQEVVKPHRHSKNILTCIDKSNNSTSKRRDYYGVKKPINLLVISKSHKETVKRAHIY